MYNYEERKLRNQLHFLNVYYIHMYIIPKFKTFVTYN